jgi:hypothetical protein
MNAYITGGFNCGFGSIYDSIYRFYNTQEYLKKLGYSVKIYVDFGLNYYRVHNNNREFIKKIFNNYITVLMKVLSLIVIEK